jgi:uncharacterized protein YdeI (YjbR/CyaY-like superfamily)
MIAEPVVFETPAELRAWLVKHHAVKRECWVTFFKPHTKRKGVTYQDALDEALCVGWIDGLVKGIDGDCYVRRFSPRRPRSIWSATNIRRAGELTTLGRMRPPGLAAFEGRDPKRANLYSYENAPRKFEGAYAKTFRANGRAWKFFRSQPPGYQRVATWWVTSAKQESTRARRLAKLMAASEDAVRIDNLVSKPPAKRAKRPAK